jgi:hypothetical protein
MPEHEDGFKRPGRAVLSASSAAELADHIETMDWTYDQNGLESGWFAQYKEQLLNR